MSTSTTVVSEGFESESESERVKEKGPEIRSFSQVQNGVVWTFTVFLFYFILFFLNTPNPVPAKIGRYSPERPERTKTTRNLTRGGMEGGGFRYEFAY